MQPISLADPDAILEFLGNISLRKISWITSWMRDLQNLPI